MLRLRHFTMLLGCCMAPSVVIGQAIVYVDVDAPGPIHDGSSWPHAFADLQAALGTALPGAEIRVAGGSYTPDGGSGDRQATFMLVSPVELNGGYAGNGAPDPDVRDLDVYETVLSGDLAGDDGPGSAGNEENSYHVMTAGAAAVNAVLDGFTISGGHADGPAPHDDGAGLYNAGGSPTLRRCLFARNAAARGGAVHNAAGSPIFSSCYMLGNTAELWGGAVDNFSGTALLLNCVLVGNTAGGEGGAIHSDLSAVTITNCTVVSNTAGNHGGGVFNYVGVELTLTNCILWSNSDVDGDGESAQLFNNPSNFVDIEHSCVQGWTGGFGGAGNLAEDPLFEQAPDPGPDGTWNGVNDDYGNVRLQQASPCVDAGDNDADIDASTPGLQPLPAQDLDGDPRLVNGVVDLGAYEFQDAGVPVLSAGSVAALTLLLLGAGLLILARRPGGWP